MKLIPSYWLVQAGKVAEGGHTWGAEGWIRIAVWTLVPVRITMRVHRRDTKRA